MTGHDDLPGPTRGRATPLSEEAVARLLDRFFEGEMPRALQDLTPPLVALERTSPPLRGSGRGAAAIVAMTALALFMAIAGVRSTPPSHRSAPLASRPSPPSGDASNSKPAELVGRSGVTVRERVESVESLRFHSANGPVEQRAERRITHVSIIDPETGSRVEVELPELTIEIIPIQD